jgi:hypothetical protein
VAEKTVSNAEIASWTTELQRDVTHLPVSTTPTEIMPSLQLSCITTTASPVEKNDDYLNGVSTLDLVMIQRHILSISKFTDPFNIIAADINNDEKNNSI